MYDFPLNPDWGILIWFINVQKTFFNWLVWSPDIPCIPQTARVFFHCSNPLYWNTGAKFRWKRYPGKKKWADLVSSFGNLTTDRCSFENSAKHPFRDAWISSRITDCLSHHHRVHPISRICPHLKMVSQIVHPILPGIPNAKHITDSNGRVDWHHFQVPFHQMWSFLMNCFLLSLRRVIVLPKKIEVLFTIQPMKIYSFRSFTQKKHAFLRIKFDFSLCCHF